MISPMKLTLLLAAITAIFYPPNLPAQTGSPSANLTVTVIHQVPDWGTYRHDPARTGTQPLATVLSDPGSVQSLAVRWQWPLPSDAPQPFEASPIVMNGVAYVGSTNGYFYALDATSGNLKWQFPEPPANALISSSCPSYGNYGIAAAAAFAHVNREDAIIFGAPDPQAEGGFGSAQLWALRAKDGTLIWSSDVVAHVSGCTQGAFPPGTFPSSPAEFHERIAYSGPLVAENFGLVYVGIHSNEAPIQEGTVRAVDLNSGTLTGFKFNSVGDGSPQIGGGVWNGPATDGSGVYFTTGNTKTWDAPPNAPPAYPTQYPNPPSDNYGLSLVRVDPISGALTWYFQPVLFSGDNDPDWNAGAAIMQTSCGQCIASVMKDGWSYGLGADGSCKWQFPFTPGNSACRFPNTENGDRHGPDGFRSPGATWDSVFVVSTGGQALITTGEFEGYGWLHALDVCSPDQYGTLPHIRWMFPVPHSTGAANSNSLGAPTVSGGIIYVTTDQGHVVAFVDPSPTYPADTQVCSNIDVGNSSCQTKPYYLVPVPHLLADVALPDGGDAAHLRKEPVLAEGMVYVTTKAGHVYALGP